MTKLAVTTSVKPTPATEAQARVLAEELGAAYVPRNTLPLPRLLAESGADRLLSVEAGRLRLRDGLTAAEYSFHPNMFQIRAAGIRRGGPDHFLEAAGLGPGDSLLDCTVGFASEAALAALVVGEAGRVVGLESVPELAAVTRTGLATFPMRPPPLEAALRRVQVISADYAAYLSTCADGALDIVYFDPFFPERLSGSEPSVSPLFVFGNPAPLDPEAVTRDACRVARRRVVIKHPRHHPLPAGVAALVTQTVGSHKSRLVYSVIDVDR